MTTGWSLSALTGAVAVGMIVLPALAPGDSEKELKPNGKGIGTLLNPGNGNANGQGKGGPGGSGSGNGIDYHGGPVMLGTVNVYYIWYGDWTRPDNAAAVGILTDLANGIGGSPYYNINTTYYDASNQHVANSIHYITSINMSSSTHGTSLSDATIQTIVTEAIQSGLPLDSNGVYFVLTSADVTASSGFCTKYCGWHTYGRISGLNIKYSFVGDPTRCPSSCMQQAKGPNGTTGADGMASVISHELEEAASDPQLNAWYDRTGMENADKCAWTFGTTYVAANGALANMTLGTRDFLIQRNWVNANGGLCALRFP
jgi:hypothetical protein